MITPLLIFLTGIATGFVDSTVGSGGLISIPFLIFLGLPPHVAIATDRFGMIGQTLAALSKFSKAKKIVWKYVPYLVIISFIGSTIGANILLKIDQKIFQKIISIILLISLFLIFLKRNLGIQHLQTSIIKKIFGFIIYFFLMIFSGFFGTGAGPLFGYTYMYFFGFTIIETKATDIFSWVILSISSMIIFASKGIIDYKNGIFLLIGMTFGGYLGAHITLKMGNIWVRRLFIIVVFLSAIKLLFFN